MANNGWIKLHRKFLEWEWFDRSEMVSLFITFLLLANHETGKWHGQTVNAGQFITGRKSLKKQTGLGEQVIRTCIDRLKSTNEITVKSTNQFSLITILNWDNYQGREEKLTSKITSKLTNEQPATNQQLTTNKNNKNDKNEKNKELATQKVADTINPLIEMFKPINPTYSRLFSDKTQRACLGRLLKLMGQDKLENAIKTLQQTNKMQFAPVITTPYELEKKMGNLIAFIQKEKLKTNLVIKL